MLKRPRLPSAPARGNRARRGRVLLSPQQQMLLRGRLYELVAPLSRRHPGRRMRSTPGSGLPREIYYTLAGSRRKQYLCEAESLLPEGQAALWSSQGIVPALAVQRLAERPIAVQTFGVDAGPFIELLTSLHVRTRTVDRPQWC